MISDQESNPIFCPRGKTELEYVGTRKFHGGTRWDSLWGFE